MPAPSILVIHAETDALAALTPLAMEGFGVRVAAGRTLRETLTQDLGLSPDYVERRVQTVFLDGSPVDDIDADHARPGGTLALAGALPGVAGIAMRRGSPVGVFREGVTHHDATEPPAMERSLPLTLKLFNIVAAECLALVLARGVDVRPGRLAELLASRPEALAQATFRLDGQPLSRAAVLAALRDTQRFPNRDGSALLRLETTS